VSWPDEERRTSDDPDTGQRRRTTDIDGPPSPRELERALARHETEAQVWRARYGERMEDAENRLSILDGRNLPGGVGLLERMAAMQSSLDTLIRLTQGIDGKTDRFASFKTLAAYIAAVLVPILLALIGGYVALRNQLPGGVPK
jgi:hypothetical protein